MSRDCRMTTPTCGAEMFAERIRIMGAAPANADTSSPRGATHEPWSAPVMILAGTAPDGRPWLWLACRGCGWFLGFAEQYAPAELARSAADHAAGCEALAPYEDGQAAEHNEVTSSSMSIAPGRPARELTAAELAAADHPYSPFCPCAPCSTERTAARDARDALDMP